MTEEKKAEEMDSSTTNTCCGSSEGSGGNIFIWLIVIATIIGAIIFFQQRNGDDENKTKSVNKKVSEEVSVVALKLIEEQLVAPGTEVEIKEITEESGLYKIELVVADQELTSYLTKDKSKFIPQIFDIKELEGADGEKENVAPATEVSVKSDKPEIELFVMSHCPYGTQMEKGILPALDALGDTVAMNWKFVDYAMHDKKEVTEQMRQYCIAQKIPTKIDDYVDCFLSGTEGSEAEARACMAQLQINAVVISQCEKEIDAKYSILALLDDKESWVGGRYPQFNIHKEDNERYGVKGSPTLVINGEVMSSGSRDSASLLKMICSAFNEQPKACMEELSGELPSSGFGVGVDTSDTGGDAGCGA